MSDDEDKGFVWFLRGCLLAVVIGLAWLAYLAVCVMGWCSCRDGLRR